MRYVVGYRGYEIVRDGEGKPFKIYKGDRLVSSVEFWDFSSARRECDCLMREQRPLSTLSFEEDMDALTVEAPAPKVFIVAVYLVDRAYGGPEEGGWWYDCGELVRIMKVFKNERAADAYRQSLDDRLQRFLNKGRPPISSMISDGMYEARLYDEIPPKQFPEHRPHYE